MDTSRISTGRARGRTLVVVVLVLALGSAGALVGWESTEPVYRSTGLVYIAPSIPTPRDPEGKSVMPMLDGFIESQVAFMRSRRVILRALETPEFRARAPEVGVASVEDRLEIDHRAGSLHILVAFSDPSPEAAAALVKSVIRAYVQLAQDMIGEGATKTLQYLQQRTSHLATERRQLEMKVLELSSRFGGPEGLTARVRSLREEVTRLESSRRALEREIQLYKLEHDKHPERLAARSDFLEREIEAVRREAFELGEASTRIQALLVEAESVREHLQQCKAAYEQVRAEASGKGRISILSEGDLPDAPHEDRRGVAAAIFGLAGAGLGLFLALVLGFVGRRLRQRALLGPAA